MSARSGIGILLVSYFRVSGKSDVRQQCHPAHVFLFSRFRIRFLKSEFEGQLPQPFAAYPGTHVLQPGFNDRNEEDRSRYVGRRKNLMFEE